MFSIAHPVSDFVRRAGVACALVLVVGAGSGIVRAQCETEFLPADGEENDNAGNAVSISGDVVVVGVRMDGEDSGNSYGSVYVLRKSGSTWIEEQKLTASDAAPYDFFGLSVVVEGDIAVVGAEGNDDNNSSSGSAYVFRFNGSSWVEEQELHALDAAWLDLFGSAVSISGDTIVVGARNEDNEGIGNGKGAAYVFRFNGATWVQEQKLLALDRAPDDHFGSSVAVSGNVVVVGASSDDDDGNSSGSAYVFRRTGSTWMQEQKLRASDGAAANVFGYSVAVHGDLAVIGAYKHNNGINFGSAYVFRFNGSRWIEETELYGSNSATNDMFAFSVSVGDDVAVIGAPDNGSSGPGAVYVFRKSGSSWVEEQKLLASDGGPYDNLGHSVAMSGDEIVAGAPGNSDNVWGAGSAYVFSLRCASADCVADGDCDDGNPCTSDFCLSDSCQHMNNTNYCNDGDACTQDDRCSNGTCVGTPVDCHPELTEYAAFADCMVGPNAPSDPACTLADFDDDGDVDLRDFAKFQLAFGTGNTYWKAGQ